MSTVTVTRHHARATRPVVRHAFVPERRRTARALPVARRSRGVHLTRRGRLLVVLVVAALLLGAFAVGRSVSQAADQPSAPAAAPSTAMVGAGDTLWSIARQVAPRRDPREVVAQIQRLNHLTSSRLQVGQQLLLPSVV